MTKDPYPLSADCFLMARDKEIVLMDSQGREQVIYTYRGEGGLHEPRPIMPRPRERVVSSRTSPSQPTGRMVLADVYRGRNLAGVNRGEICKLLVLESLPKPVNFSGGPDLVSWLGTFTLERVLGTVPVEADGSAYFELPANRQVFFVALDDGDLSVKRMQSSASPLLKMVDGSHYDVKVTPHEWRRLWLWIESGAPYVGSYAGLRNTRQQELAGAATAAVFAGKRDVLHRRCADCHSVTPQEETAARPLPFAKEWNERNKQLAGRPTGAYERVVFADDPIARYSAHILLNFTRPELSPLLLAPLAKASGGLESCGAVFRDQTDSDYQALLAGLREGKALLDAEPRYGTPDFQPNPQYVREMRKYGILPATFNPNKDRLDVFHTDQRYWESFWYQPAANTAMK